MQRFHRALAAATFIWVLVVIEPGCASLANTCGAVMKLALGVGLGVGSYYLVKALH